MTTKLKPAWIRPVHRGDDGPLIGLALCCTNGKCLVDGDVIEHFPKDASGKEIKLEAVDLGYEAEWGSVLN